MTRSSRGADNPFAVVGVGASAGGVEALQAFFSPMPPEPGMAFIVVTHLGQGYESALPQILSRSTKLPIIPARHGEAIEPNRVYVLVSDSVPTLRRGKLHLRQSPNRHQYNPIDVFLASLAEDRGEYSVAVILSGTGHDGTLGAKAIKEKGGLTIAQQTDHTAPRYPDMPDNAMASGAIDLKLPAPAATGEASATKSPMRAKRSATSCATSSGTISPATRNAPSCAASSAACRCSNCAISKITSSGCGRTVRRWSSCFMIF